VVKKTPLNLLPLAQDLEYLKPVPAQLKECGTVLEDRAFDDVPLDRGRLVNKWLLALLAKLDRYEFRDRREAQESNPLLCARPSKTSDLRVRLLVDKYR
jgi:hypothetical protein